MCVLNILLLLNEMSFFVCDIRMLTAVGRLLLELYGSGFMLSFNTPAKGGLYLTRENMWMKNTVRGCLIDLI